MSNSNSKVRTFPFRTDVGVVALMFSISFFYNDFPRSVTVIADKNNAQCAQASRHRAVFLASHDSVVLSR